MSIAAGSVPLKFAYAGRAAFAHDSYARTSGYSEMMTSARRETDALLAARRGGPAIVDIAEIGPGNGLHTTTLLDSLRTHGLDFRRYLGVDFSATLLRISAGAVRRRFPTELVVSTAVWDVESRPEGVIENWRSGAGPVLLCLVGHTLGNFEDPSIALRNIARELRVGDILLASVLLRPTANAIEVSMAAYRTAEFRRAALEPMLAAGMNASEMDFSIEYRDGAFVGEVTLPHGARLDDVDLPCGYRFRCFMSRRFDSTEVIRLLEGAGWAIYETDLEQDSDHMTVVASRAEEPL